MAIDKDKLIAAIEQKAETAYGSDTDSQLARHRATLIEAYLGLNTNPAPEGRSQVVDRSVFETIHTMLPSLVRIFASSSDEVVKFVPVGPEDEPAAEQTTAYVNHVVTQKNPWEQICADWIHDAMLLGNGYCLAYWDESEEIEREKYEGQSDEQIAALLADGEVAVVGHEMSDEVDPMTGMPLHTVEIERKKKAGQVKICVLPPEHCRVDSDTPDWSLERCDFFEYRELKSIADLRAMGLDVPDDISDIEDLNVTPEDNVRDRFSEQFNFDAGDDPGIMRKVVARMIWIRAAIEKDNEARLYYAIVVGRTPLYCEPCTRIPVASMSPIPLPHRHPGLSVAEITRDLQDIKTAIKRGGLDNLYLANNGRHAISDKVSIDDFLDSRPGGVIRLMDGAMPGDGHIFPITHPFAFDGIIGALEYFDQDRQNRSGANRYFAGTDAGALNKTASGVAQLTNQAAQRVEHYARMFAPAVEYLFSVVLELIQKHANKPAILKLRGQWVAVDPKAWMTKRDVRISVGVGAGNKDSMLAQLSMTLQEQMVLSQVGLAKPENLYETVIEKMKLQGFANPQKFYTDPRQSPPPPPPIPPELAQKMQEQLAKLAEENAKLRIGMEEKDLKLAEKDLELKVNQVGVELERKSLDVAKQEVGLTKQGVDMAAKQFDGEAQRKAEEEQAMKEELAQLIAAIVQSQQMQAQQMAQVVESLNGAAQAMVQVAQATMAPKERMVMRGPDGKVTGLREMTMQ